MLLFRGKDVVRLTVHDDAVTAATAARDAAHRLIAELDAARIDIAARDEQIASLQDELEECRTPTAKGLLGWNTSDARFGAYRLYATPTNKAAKVEAARAAAEQGLYPLFSLKPPRGAPGGWQDVASGSADAYIRDVVNALPPCDFAFHHEPEDDAPSDGADFKRAFDRVAGLLPSGIRPVVCLMAFTFNTTKRNPADWLPTSAEAIALDAYNWFGVPDRADRFTWTNPPELLRPVVAPDAPPDTPRGPLVWLSDHGDERPISIWETNSREDPADPNRKANWVRAYAPLAETEGLEQLVFYDSTGASTVFRLFSSTAATAAVSELVARPYFAR